MFENKWEDLYEYQKEMLNKMEEQQEVASIKEDGAMFSYNSRGKALDILKANIALKSQIRYKIEQHDKLKIKITNIQVKYASAVNNKDIKEQQRLKKYFYTNCKKFYVLEKELEPWSDKAKADQIKLDQERYGIKNSYATVNEEYSNSELKQMNNTEVNVTY